MAVTREERTGPQGDPTGVSTDVSVPKHFYKCAFCGAWVDSLDIEMVLDHHGPLPHPVADKPR
jgi:hypothetical protein